MNYGIEKTWSRIHKSLEVLVQITDKAGAILNNKLIIYVYKLLVN